MNHLLSYIQVISALLCHREAWEVQNHPPCAPILDFFEKIMIVKFSFFITSSLQLPHHTGKVFYTKLIWQNVFNYIIQNSEVWVTHSFWGGNWRLDKGLRERKNRDMLRWLFLYSHLNLLRMWGTVAITEKFPQSHTPPTSTHPFPDSIPI